MGMRILVVGSGAREHALCWKLAQSAGTDALWCAPGNPGTATVATNLPVKVNDLDGIAAAAAAHRIELVVVGPEEPLALGLADRLTEAGFSVCGPSAAAARIESSKSWAKEIMRAAGVPTAGATVVTNLEQGLAALPVSGYPGVLKADGLAAGKGVVIAATRKEAGTVLAAFLEEGYLGAAGSTVLIEEYLTGQEISVFGLSDGETVLTLGVACDYKRAGDGDAGPSRGNGRVRPRPDRRRRPPAHHRDDHSPPHGPGDGRPGRSLSRAFLRRPDPDGGRPQGDRVQRPPRRPGNPGRPPSPRRRPAHPLRRRRPPLPRRGYSAASAHPGRRRRRPRFRRLPRPLPDGPPYHRSGRRPGRCPRFPRRQSEDAAGRIVTSGGRVLSVVGTGPDLATARTRASAGIAAITFPGAHHRTDIALRDV